MKRSFTQNAPSFGGGATTREPSFVLDKGKMWVDSLQCHDAGQDEQLAEMGYTVRAADMAEVAHKIEQLEVMMGIPSSAQQGLRPAPGLVEHLESETDHYNPSDMSGWLESMISEAAEISLPQNFDYSSIKPQFDNNDFYLPPAESSTINDYPTLIYDEPTSSSYDLSAIPGEAICGERDKKRIKQEMSQSLSPPTTEPIQPIVLTIDSQENGIRLVHSLMACAEAVQQENLKLAESLVKQISVLAASQAGAMRKVATYFAEALARRIFQFSPQPALDSSFIDILQIHYYETCPHLKFAHFTANQAILDSLSDITHVHIIDFSMKHGMQWPVLMQALAIRPNGPPSFRLTGIGPPQPDNTDALQQVGWKLAQFAESLHVPFEYRGFVVTSLADLDASMLNLRPDETVVVNSVFELHPLLARPGGIEKVLKSIRKMKPKIVTIVEQEANHNGPVFLDRFTESLHYFSTLFDSLEGYATANAEVFNGQDMVMSEMYFGRQICNIVACEGADRVERHECWTQWKSRMESAGFVMSHLGSNTFKRVSPLLSMFGGSGGYEVDESDGCLKLGWHTRPLVASSAWRLR